jgi:hypothetical protein
MPLAGHWSDLDDGRPLDRLTPRYWKPDSIGMRNYLSLSPYTMCADADRSMGWCGWPIQLSTMPLREDHYTLKFSLFFSCFNSLTCLTSSNRVGASMLIVWAADDIPSLALLSQQWLLHFSFLWTKKKTPTKGFWPGTRQTARLSI